MDLPAIWDTGRFLARNMGSLFIQAFPAWCAAVLVFGTEDFPFPVPAAGSAVLVGVALWLNMALATMILGCDREDRLRSSLSRVFRLSEPELRVAGSLLAGGVVAALGALAVTVVGIAALLVPSGGLIVFGSGYFYLFALMACLPLVVPRFLPWCVLAARGDPLAFSTGARLGRRRTARLFLTMLPTMAAVGAMAYGWLTLREALLAGTVGLPALPPDMVGRLDSLGKGTVVVVGVVLHAATAAVMVHRLRDVGEVDAP